MTLLEVAALVLFGAAAGSLLTVLLNRPRMPEDDGYMRQVQHADPWPPEEDRRA